jgi:hypothetical protein
VDHARFVHRSRGTRRRVGAQQEHFLFGTGGGALDDGRQEGAPFVLPEREAFEAVDDLEETVALGRDADRQVTNSGLRLRAWRLHAAQTFQTGAQPVDRDHGYQRPRVCLCRLGHVGCGLHGSVR